MTFSSTPIAVAGVVWVVQMCWAANSCAATSSTARITVSHDTPNWRATDATDRPSSPTRRAASTRARWVSTA